MGGGVAGVGVVGFAEEGFDAAAFNEEYVNGARADTGDLEGSDVALSLGVVADCAGAGVVFMEGVVEDGVEEAPDGRGTV